MMLEPCVMTNMLACCLYIYKLSSCSSTTWHWWQHLVILQEYLKRWDMREFNICSKANSQAIQSTLAVTSSAEEKWKDVLSQSSVKGETTVVWRVFVANKFPDYSASQKFLSPAVLWKSFPNGWEFLIKILHAYYTFICIGADTIGHRGARAPPLLICRGHGGVQMHCVFIWYTCKLGPRQSFSKQRYGDVT